MKPIWVDLQVNGYAGVDFNAPGLTVAAVKSVTDRLAADGTEAIAEVTAEDGYGMSITAHLPVALPPGKGKVVLMTHGKRTPEGELHQCVKSVTILAGDTPAGITLTGVHAPGIEPPMIHLESGVWFDGTGLDGWTGGEGDEILAKNNRAEEAEWTRVDLHEDVGGEVVFDGGMLKMDEGAWTILDNLGIVEGSEVRFKVTVGGNSAETVATVAEA